jgi:hypothetical protein
MAETRKLRSAAARARAHDLNTYISYHRIPLCQVSPFELFHVQVDIIESGSLQPRAQHSLAGGTNSLWLVILSFFQRLTSCNWRCWHTDFAKDGYSAHGHVVGIACAGDWPRESRNDGIMLNADIAVEI